MTLVTAGIASRVANWQVLDEESASDHHYLEFTIGAKVVQPTPALRWSTKGMSANKFNAAITSWHPDGNATAEQCALELSATLTTAIDASAPKKTPRTNRKSVYWWSPEIGRRLRKTSNHSRRTYQRLKVRGEESDQARNAARQAKRELVPAIRDAKEAAWAELLALVDTDPWGKPYRLVMS